MMLNVLISVLMLFVSAFNVYAAEKTMIPVEDLKGAKDSPLIGRYKGSFIVSYDWKDFDELTLPLSKLEKVKDKRDSHNNNYFEPQEKKTIEGVHTRLVYVIPENVSPLEVLRNYQEEITGKGGEILYECKEQECGGDPSRGSHGGGGDMSLSMFLRPEEHIKDKDGSPGGCAQAPKITGQRYTVGSFNDSGAHVSILAYTIKEWPSTCPLYVGRTIAAVDIIQPKQREQKMVTIKAEEMAGKITTTGRIALYGIYFDFNKADIKPESQPTLEQIAKLLKDDGKLKLLVVGHTDNSGTFAFNMDLSQRRANSVVNALVTQYKIDGSRLTPVGVSFACPVETNKTEEGRAKNRRVELVEN
jgi:outer membrane protein OmpA-like peptidoglycan-associated protein